MFELTDPESQNWMAEARNNAPGERSTAQKTNDTFGTSDAGVQADQSFSEGDEVDTPSGMGVVVEIRTEPFEGPSGDDVDASDDSPAYVVAVEDGAKVYRADDLSDGSIDVEGVDDPSSDLADEAEAMLADVEAADDGRRFNYPDSWDESPTPNRIILLKAWAGLGGRFTSCRREMTGEIASPARFCASMKDSVLQWEGWRQGG